MLSSLQNISKELPILIAGPTASGKSALAGELAAKYGGVIVNADALQVFSDWRVLTARPTAADETQHQHHLYGHVAGDFAYSVGHWLRDVTPLLTTGQRPIIVGGTGLYFTALTQGLADIPPTAPDIRALGDQKIAAGELGDMLDEIDPDTRARIDTKNPVRIQRAWEVWRTTGKSLAQWQDSTPPPVLPLQNTHPILLNADKDWLNQRIASRFDAMLSGGALDEARTNAPGWNPALPSAKAIGASQLIQYLAGTLSLDAARDSATIATRQYAKRQRSWFRARMAGWSGLNLP